jgi:hypothetical protein
MQTDTRLPVYAHWRDQVIVVDLAENQPRPDIGSIVHLTVDVDGSPRRLPFKITGKRQRTDPEHEAGLLARIGFDGGALPSAVDIDVEPHDPEH